jgi:hypothetical protein
MKSFYVDCPFCDGMMEIDAETGKMIKKWAPSEKLSADQDKMAAALEKLGQEKKRRETILDDTRHRIDEQKKKAENLFKKQVEKIKKEGISEKPSNPFDLD